MVVNALARAACAALGSLSFLGIFSTCVLPYWKMSSWQTSSALYGRMPTYDGVWWQCMTLKAGGFTCSNYGKPSIFLSADIQAMRAMMCIASIASFFAVLCSLLSLDCSSLLETNSKPKNVVAFVAGVLYAIAGVMCGAAVSWYAWRVTYEYFSPFYQEKEFKYEFGSCLYMGWVSTALALISGLILICGSCKRDKDDEDKISYPYSYQPSKVIKETKTEYV